MIACCPNRRWRPAIPNPDTYYFAHDYAATSLARFFSLAEAETQPLNQQERDLLALLVGAHVIERAASGYVAATPEMAVVTLVQPEPGLAAARPSMPRCATPCCTTRSATASSSPTPPIAPIASASGASA